MITASVRPVKMPQPVVKITMERKDAERLHDMISHMVIGFGPLSATLTQLSDAFDKAGITWDISESPFKNGTPQLGRR